MKNDFVLSESEISIATNKISAFADFLTKSIDTYVMILSELDTDGIKDEKIDFALANLKSLVRLYQINVGKVNEKLLECINSEIEEAELNDIFEFPLDFMTEVISILARFF